MAEQRSVQLAGRTLDCGCHACAFFNSRDEEYQLLAPFVADALDCGEKSFHIVDPGHQEERYRLLKEAGVETEAARESGQLEVRSWGQAYLRESKFDQNAMLALIEELLKEGREQGYGLTRLWANMEWALEDMPGVHDIVEYEARLNQVLPNYDDVVVCTYDVTRFSASVVMDILRTHPHVIIGGILQENPFFVPPEKFLEELRGRGARPE